LPWPDNEGFRYRRPNVLKPGKIVDRYGSPDGGFLGEPGYTVSQRGMPPIIGGSEPSRYRVLKEIPVDSGPAAGVPEFGAIGGAPQHYTGERSVQWLLDNRYLEKL